MDSEIISAIIAVVGVFVSVAISLLIGFWGKRHNEKQLFAETVSSNRMDWINKWRENISIFLANAEMLREMLLGKSKGTSYCGLDKSADSHCKCDKFIALKTEMLKARTMITSRLNLNEDLHILMFSAIKQLDYSEKNDKFNAQREYIEELARQILKLEWERVKNEAKGKEK